MYSRKNDKWIKHLDFTIIDILCICLALFLAYGIRHGFANEYARDDYREVGFVMIILDLLIVFFKDSYKSVIRRGYLKEFKAVIVHFSLIMVGLQCYLFIMKQSQMFSRMTIILTWVIGSVLMYLARIVLKKWLRKRMLQRERLVSVLAVASAELANETIKGLKRQIYSDFQVIGIMITGSSSTNEEKIDGVPVIAFNDNYKEYIKNHVVDEIFINVIDDYDNIEKIVESCVQMGITVHQNLLNVSKGAGKKVVDEFADYVVLTSSLKVAAYRDLFIKRCMDILGGLVGLLITAVMFPFVAIAIKAKSKGPVLFSQERIGKNGRTFKIYKFRSMYVNAEKRKKELMQQNEMQGFMFKMKDDPRIIPGVGEFIRKTSIDEFPQFWNVLKGDMSLVGTRPPTVAEYEQYDMHHLVRMSIKPGLTGLWQVSGRNRITDFEEVVRLDTKYIEEWNLNLDIKILLKTIAIVFLGNGE